MGDKPKDTFARVRSILSGRVTGYQLLMLDCVTPLLHKELLDAIKQHQEMLQRPDPTTPDQDRVALRQLGHLDSIDAHISEHWKGLNEDLVCRTALLANIMVYQGFLARSILLDYAGHSQREAGLDSWVADRVDTLDLYQRTVWRSNKNSDIKMYQETITAPIKELMLDQAHVERRIRTAAAEPSPTGEIWRLIEECDWPTLAMKLIRDRELAVTLYSYKPLDPDSYNDNIAQAVLRKMDEIRDRYFTELQSPSTYTTSKHAKERSARKEAGLPLPPEPARHSEGDRLISAAKGVFSKVISSFGMGAAAASSRRGVDYGTLGHSPRLSMDSTTHLLSSKERRD